MLKSLFNKYDSQEIIDRINRLNPNSEYQWGKMNAAQMLTHAQRPFKVAFEELKLKRGLIGILFGGMVKKKFLGESPFSRNSPTAKHFLVHDSRDFETEKKNLISIIQRFEKSESSITKEDHPFFGKMTPHEWDVLMWKHLDHHLRQFGV